MIDASVPRRRRRRPALWAVAWIAIMFAASGRHLAADHAATSQPSPQEALSRLREGNARFAAGTATHPHCDAARRLETFRHGQHPFATIVSCSDSRVPVELLFDQGIGDLFIIRVAGNVCATDETGSIEYAVEHLNIPLIVVLGHRDCGAVSAVVAGESVNGNLSALVDHIAPAVEKARSVLPGLAGRALVAEAVRANVWHSVEDLLRHSAFVHTQIEAGRIQVIGAIYDLETARIDWLGPHPEQSRLLTIHEFAGAAATPPPTSAPAPLR